MKLEKQHRCYVHEQLIYENGGFGGFAEEAVPTIRVPIGLARETVPFSNPKDLKKRLVEDVIVVECDTRDAMFYAMTSERRQLGTFEASRFCLCILKSLDERPFEVGG